MNPLSKNGYILITGGAGFIGSNLAISFKKRYPKTKIIALDNLKRRGSELNIKRLKNADIIFSHGDVRNKEDLIFENDKISVIIECSAEPSVLAGIGESPEYVLNTNLLGAINCFELARRQKACLIFLSSSRIYPYTTINQLNYNEEKTRFALINQQSITGVSKNGIAENFPLTGKRSLYGASKLSAEFIASEYSETYNVDIIINRCGVVAGPWQMAKVDQGVFSLWMAAHYFNKPLKYIGFGGKGKQVRDVLHIDDLFTLIDLQLTEVQKYTNDVYNVGGGKQNSLSLLELTALCEETSKRSIPINQELIDRPADIKCFISDCTKIQKKSNWFPQKTKYEVMEDILQWIRDHENNLKHILI